ncbi:MAG: cytochrome [Polaromonas sp.]|jgi:cytochrome b|nr:cytochrome [Polaromonas sp.]
MFYQKTLTKVRVWDLPTRIFHWALAIGMVGLAISGTVGGNAMVWHFRFGYAVLALLLFRLVWGLVGGYWSRFGAFIYAPQSIIDYLKGKGQPEHSVGHSPVGALSVFAMLAFLVFQVGSGLVSDDEIAFSGPLTRFVSNATVSLATNYHANIGKWILLALVLMHMAAIVFYLLRKHNLVGAMLHGDKELVRQVPASRDDTASRLSALLVFLLCAGVAYWVSTLEVAAF